MTGREERPSGPLDVDTLEVIARRAIAHPVVTEWTYRPDSISPRVLELRLDGERYPDSVDAARLDVRWFDGGDYTVHYLETNDDGINCYQCRWDRHPKPNAPRAHFHPPPDAGPAEPSPLDGDHHLDIVFGVLEWLAGRIRDRHE